MPSRRVITLGLAGTAAAALGAAAALAVVTTPALGPESPAAGAVVTARAPVVGLSAQNGEGLAEVAATLDGAPVTVRLSDRGVRLATGDLDDGPHRVHLQASLPGPLGGRVVRDWAFTVDTRAPALTVLEPAGRWSATSWLLGRSEPGATVQLAWPGATLAQTVAADGLFRFRPAIPPGRTVMRLSVHDAAGNERQITRTFGFDPDPPVLDTPAWPSVVRDSSSPVLPIGVTDLSRVQAVVTVDGDAFHPDAVPGGFELRFHGLAEGRHRIVATLADRAGHTVEVSRSFVVDSTEVLTPDLTLMPGARGRDVKSLTRRLRLEGAWSYRGLARVYDGRVRTAVQRYQKRHGMPADGVARPALLARTQGKIVIVKHEFRLYAYRDGRLAATFPIAIGQPRYPSPTGSFVIVEKLKNPTWIPPNSPWAKGLEPIPPGSGNPLGTRWIGTSAPAVGIHGTPSDWTIGTAASHGCIRMHIPDVERLFELVDVGETVDFKP